MWAPEAAVISPILWSPRVDKDGEASGSRARPCAPAVRQESPNHAGNSWQFSPCGSARNRGVTGERAAAQSRISRRPAVVLYQNCVAGARDLEQSLPFRKRSADHERHWPSHASRTLAPLPGDVDFTVSASLPISGLTRAVG